MTSPREQAIEAAAQIVAGRVTFVGPVCSLHRDVAREIIDAYESARARLDGAKMMPREATEEMLEAGIDAANSRRPVPDIYRAMHDATPKEMD